MALCQIIGFWSDEVNYIEYDTYIDTLNFLINGRRQNLCWLMTHCSLDRDDEWRDKQFTKIQSDIDAWMAELEIAKQSMGEIHA